MGYLLIFLPENSGMTLSGIEPAPISHFPLFVSAVAPRIIFDKGGHHEQQQLARGVRFDGRQSTCAVTSTDVERVSADT